MKQIIFCALASFLSFAAITETRAQRTITFEPRTNTSKHKSRKKHSDAVGMNTLAIGIAQYFDGYTPITYERMITDWFTVAVGVGPTYRSRFIDLALELYDEGVVNGGYNVNNQYYSYKYRDAKVGYAVSVAPRFYYHESSMDGAYISPTLEYRRYRFDALQADGTQPLGGQSIVSDDVPRTTAVTAETMDCYDVSAVAGGSYQLRHHMNIGWTVGIGLRNRTSDRLNIGYTDRGTSAVYYTNQVHSYSTSKLFFSFGFSVGGWW